MYNNVIVVPLLPKIADCAQQDRVLDLTRLFPSLAVGKGSGPRDYHIAVLFCLCLTGLLFGVGHPTSKYKLTTKISCSALERIFIGREIASTSCTVMKTLLR